MPYNRYNDTLQALNAGSDLVTSFSNDSIKRQAMGNTMEDRAIEKANERQIDSNLTLRKNGKAMGGTNQIQNESNRQFTNAALVDELQQGIELKEVDRAWGVNFIQGARDTPNDELPDYYAKVKPQTEGQLQFVANFSEKIAQTKEYQNRLAKGLNEEATIVAKKYFTDIAMAQEHIKNGNRDLGEQGFMKTINEMPHIINIEKGNNGKFNIVFREGGVNKGVLLPDATLEEAIQEAQKIPPEKIKRNYVGLRLQSNKENIELSKTPITWINKKGDTIKVYEQKDFYNPTEENVVFGFDSNSKSLNNGEPQKYTDLMGKGFSPQNLADDANKALINQRNASTNASNAKNKLAKGQLSLTDLKKQLEIKNTQFKAAARIFDMEEVDEYLIPDKKGGEEETPAAKNLLERASDFLDTHQNTASLKTAKDVRKYNMARKLLDLTDEVAGNKNQYSNQMLSDEQGQAASRQQLVEQTIQGLLKAQGNNDSAAIAQILSQFQGQDKNQIIAMAREKAKMRSLGEDGQPVTDMTWEYRDFPSENQQAMGNPIVKEWDKTPLGKFESAIKQTPEALRQSEVANKEAYDRGLKNKTSGSAIPSSNTFRRTY